MISILIKNSTRCGTWQFHLPGKTCAISEGTKTYATAYQPGQPHIRLLLSSKPTQNDIEIAMSKKLQAMSKYTIDLHLNLLDTFSSVK